MEKCTQIRYNSRKARPVSKGTIFFVLCLAGCLASYTGCGSEASFRGDAWSSNQKRFLEIRELHEEGNSRKVLRKGLRFLEEVDEEELRRPVLYYLAEHSERSQRIGAARRYYQKLIEESYGSRWAILAAEGLRSIEERVSEGGTTG